MNGFDHLLAGLKEHVTAMIASQAVVRIGIVTSYNPNDHTLRCRIMPEDVLSGWIPISSPSVGALSVVIPPIPGQQCVLQPDTGDGQNMICTGLLHDALDTPGMAASSFGGTPANASPGELLIRGPGGFSMVVGQDGSVHVVSSQARFDCDIHCNGDIYDKHGSLDRLRGHYNSHLHTGVQSGSANTGTTTIPDPE